ncbi:phage tail sheath family protein [Nostoc sp.]|uniref:phage tail sheath family protein n=1 Tax=Nostoc sp. TaxID=1180 RepID=UPI002FFC4223
MPEYLAPGVYVEEVDTGSKPIEGVSTSTSGMVGVTAWGPEKIATLVTGFADFQRQFGGYLDANNYSNASYLPHAVEGFFTNGGKRLYIVRVLPTTAVSAATYLVDQALPSTVNTTLAEKAIAGTTELTLDSAVDATKVTEGKVFKLDEGQFAEYIRTAEKADATTKKVKLEYPLSHDHVKGATFNERNILLKVEAIDRGNWGNTLQVTPDDDESLLETSVAADALKYQPKVTLNTTQGIEPGSILGFYIQRAVLTCAVVLKTNLSSKVERGTRVRFKGTDWETTVTQEAAIGTNKVTLESVEKLKLDNSLEFFLRGNSPSVLEDDVVSIEINLNQKLAEDLKTSDNIIAYIRGSRVDAKLTADAAKNSNTVNLDRGAGVERGAALIFQLFQEKVASVDKKVVTLANNLGKLVTAGWLVRTREFKLRVDCVQTNPLTRQKRVVMSETHRHLTLDPRHSRYVVRVIGTIPNGTTLLRPDGRTEGGGQLIRVYDILTPVGVDDRLTDKDERIKQTRLGPELILGSPPIPLGLTGGDDQIATLSDLDYKGQDNIDPQQRTGLQALKNIEEVSVVAIPGRTSQRIQEEVINHCELMRYRFAVIDSLEKDGMAQVQVQRSNYDTKYAALYYPWLRIPDPFPDNPQVQGNVSIPPSGHVMGIYARSDIERGVYKAPANEVIRGIADLEVKLMKEQQDILNPRNINVLRNFRENNRGLRVWGARRLSSDPDWKYVNVRRLFIFIENSIDRGTQWVVFEPNDEPLWQRVKRVITAFLTQVWRDGALMGQTREEAFFVKCDRTTMTQNDIDNGRLIVQIGIAPVKPAEFVIFRIGQWTGGSSLEEN